MTVPKKKVSFARISKLMKTIDTTVGAFLLRDSTRKKSIKELIFKHTMPRISIMYVFILISTLIVTDFQLISIIIGGSLGSIIFALSASLIYFISNADSIKKQLKWCENLYDVKKKFHKVIHSIAEAQLMTVERKTSKFIKWIRIIFYVDIVGITLGFAILGIFLPEKLFPKYSLSVPIYLPFRDQKTWLAFVTTTLFQTIISIDAATMVTFLFVISVGVAIHAFGYLDIILETVEMMKNEILTKTRKKPHQLLDQQILNLKTLADGTFMQSQKNNTLSIDEWIKILNEMISDVSSIITTLSNLCAIPLLFLELAGLGSLFIFGLLFTVIREQYLFALGINIVCFCLFIACFVNEKFFDKFEEINEALYDIPWYYLTPNQRKSLMIVMHCDKIQRGLTAAKIHSLTIERFGIIVKAGYTNLLVLKDLVQK